MTTAEIEVVKDYDGKWASRWPADLVSTGRSPGAGRHDTRQALIDAIERRGWSVTRHEGTWEASRI